MTGPARILVVCVTLAACDASASVAAQAPEPTQPAASEPCTLVELFTSQGCSSCPPADELLDALVAAHGDRIAPLAFHVDYWDDLGWPDPFAAPRWSARQRAYAAAVASSRVYTPQLVFAGRDHGVGTSRRRAEAALAEVAQQPSGVALEVAIERGASTWRVEVTGRGRPTEPVDVFVAITQDGLTTEVLRGENAGRTLAGNHVVRELVRACEWSAQATTRCETSIDLAADWNRDALGVVVFAQERATMRILGAARAG